MKDITLTETDYDELIQMLEGLSVNLKEVEMFSFFRVERMIEILDKQTNTEKFKIHGS